MKSLEKDRERRYETANAFAADVLHFLADEPENGSLRLEKYAWILSSPGASLSLLD